VIPWADELPPRLDDGTYHAVMLSSKKVDRFGLTTVQSRWRLLLPDSREHIYLLSYCRLGPTKHAKIRAGSKLASWQRAVSAFTSGNPTHVTLKSFREFWFHVIVRTVTRNADGPLHARDQYSVVDDILSVGGKLSDLPADGPPHVATTVTTPSLGYPPFIPGLGPLMTGALDRCESCPVLTAFSYGGHAVCLTHARQRVTEEGKG
jgi:hypothetical protein